jgi:hypothetical protein
MKAYGGVDVQTHVFLTLALVEGEWSASYPSHFTPGERALVPIGQDVGWTTEPVCTTWRSEDS